MLIIDMVTGEVLEETRRQEDAERVEAERPPRPDYGPSPDLVPVTPERHDPPPPPPFWRP